MVERNTHRLQTLIDELLELSKIESGKMTLTLTKANLTEFLKPVILSFESMAESSGITFTTVFSEDESTGYFDKDKLEKIIYNLISNAIKYTKDSINIKTWTEKEDLFIKVADNGQGLKEEELEQIFDRFYRVEGSEKKGSGIGLALCKELVELQNGQISVESEIDHGTTFLVRIPVSLEKLPQTDNISKSFKGSISEIEKPVTEKVPEQTSDLEKGKVRILIVEDNQDLQNYISGILNQDYDVTTAINGIEGEKIAIETIPDIIISDVMMPEKNGYELCQSLKTNIKTSHIPLILLTAKAGHQSKMEGLTHGADVYLTKPFDSEELLLRIKNLLNNRDRLWNKVKTNQNILIDDLELTSMDDDFFAQVTSSIKNNLDDETFSVEKLAAEIGFSRSQLFRKMKSLFNKTPNQLITEIRLNKAHELLKNNSCSVSEAAYAVGYSNLSYFTKSFKERFGVAPSKILQN